MNSVNEKNNRERLYRDQLLTTSDLEEFKRDLIAEFKKLLKEVSGQPAKRWLKTPEVCKLLEISPNTLANMRLNGTLPYTKIGGVIYYSYEDIQRMFSSNKPKATPLNSRL